MAEPTLLEALREREALYSAIVNQANDSIALIDAKTGRFIEFNEAACRHLGYTSEEFTHLRVQDVEITQTAGQLAARFAQITQEGGVIFESRHRCKNGDIHDVRISVRSIHIAGHHYFASIWSDISEQKRFEEQLRASEFALKEAQTVARLGSWTLDIPKNCLTWSNETYRIFDVAETTPLTLEFFLGHIHPEDHDRVIAAWNAALTGTPYDLEHRILVQGRVCWVRERARIHFDNAGQPVFAVGTIQDFTERRQIEVELAQYRDHLEKLVQERTAQLEAANEELIRARDAAEAANYAKGTFLANMSHEIRTPMNAIIGLTHLLQRDAADARQREQLRKIAEAARHLLGIINDILDLSKIEAGKLSLEQIDFALTTTLDSICILISDKIEAKGLALVRILDPAVPKFLRGDPLRLGQILLNFVSNAVKFTEQGSITLRVQLLEQTEEQVRIRFAIQDTGIGISVEQQRRMFHAFEQADGSTTRKYGGTGLGLAISQRLVQLMGGELGVESTLDVGSTFWFTADFAHSRGTLTPETPARPWCKVRQRARILLAEDNLVNQEVACELLEEAGLTVEVAENGARAVEMAQQSVYDLILMDVQMPILDGLQATRLIRRIPGRQHTPILAMTANAFYEDRARCLAAGMDDHVAKPVEPDRLLEALAKWLPMEDQSPTPQAVLPTDPAMDEPHWDGRLATIPDLDAQLGLRCLRGNLVSYMRLLRKYATAHDKDIHYLRERLAADDRVEARMIAHSLKGASATLGAVAVQQRAAELEAALRAGCTPAELEPLIEAVETARAMLSAAIWQALPNEEETPLVAVNWPRIRSLVGTLKTLLAEDNLCASQVFAEAAPLLRAGFGDSINPIERYIDAFEYEQALDVLQALITGHAEFTRL